MKAKKCKACGAEFQPFRSLQRVCSPLCAIELARDEKKESFKRETRKMRTKLNDSNRSYWLKKAQAAVNSYIRARDKGVPCVSCAKPDDGSHQRHASHYRSVGACSSLRFNTWNIHASCMQCNSILSGNITEYRIKLTAKIGEARVDWLECQNGIVRYDIDYLKRMTKIFTKRAKSALLR